MRAELKKRYLILALVGLSSFAADQVTKIWARGALRSPTARRYIDDSENGKKDSISVIEKRVEFRLSFNKGAAFGMFADAKGGRWWLIIVGILAMGLIFYLLHRPEAESKLFLVALSLVTGGAIGNLWDRIFFGEVTDFIVVWLTKSIDVTWPWPAFNIADAVLVIGVGLMMIHILITWREDHLTEEKNTSHGDRKQGDGDKKTGDGDKKTGDGDKKTGDGDKKTGDGDKKTGDGDKKTGDGDKKTGDGDKKTGDGAQHTDDGTKKTDDPQSSRKGAEAKSSHDPESVKQGNEHKKPGDEAKETS